jgi:hypothetical protein
MYEFAGTVCKLPAEQQNEFFSSLKDILSDDEYLATVKFISSWGMFRSPAKFKAIRSAISEALFGISISDKVPTMFES